MFELGKKSASDKHPDDPGRQLSEHTLGASDTEATPIGAATGRGDVAVIGRSIRIDGDLRGEEDLRIEGDVNGTIQLKNHTLTIGSEGKIKADVYAKSVTVDGVMEGDICGSEQVSIRKTARVRGNIVAPRVSLEDGAKFKGSIEMDSEAVQAALGEVAGDAPSASAPEERTKIASKPTPISTSTSSDETLAAKAKAAPRSKAAQS